jgi:hypothetical protein
MRIKPFSPSVASLLLAILASFLTTWLAPPAACNLGLANDLACARGFEARERSGSTTFRWSDGYAELHMAGVGSGRPLLATLTLRSGRPAGSAPVVARFGLNGHPLADIAVSPADRHYRLLLPPLSWPAGGLARIQVHSPTWKPSLVSRSLGLVFIRANVEPVGRGIPLPGLRSILSWWGMLLAVALLARSRVVLWQGGIVLLLLLLALVSPLVSYLPWVAGIVGVGAVAWNRSRRSRMGSDTVWPFVWAAILAALFLLLISGVLPSWARLPLLTGCGTLAVVGALHWWRRPWVFWRAGEDEAAGDDAGVALVFSAALLRFIILGGRLLGGHTWIDADVNLFYAYGMALRETGLPEVEYPTGALLPWAFLSWLSSDSRELFALLLPLINIGCDLVIVAALVRMGRGFAYRPHSEIPSPLIFAPAAFYAFSPLLESFVFAKYDALPAALAVGGLALFASRRVGLAGAALGLGATIKWTPLLAVPFLALALLRWQRWRKLALFLSSHIGAIALCSLPFALANLEHFLLPYQIQGGRGMNGESVWALLALLKNPDLAQHLAPPWGTVRRGGLPLSLMVGGQLALLGGSGLLALLRPPTLHRTLMLAALAPPLFLLSNRVFSPQYVLPISAGLLAAVSLARPFASPPPRLPLFLTLLALAQVGNMLVWPLHHSQLWIGASVVLFVALFVVCGWLALLAARDRVRPATRSARGWPQEYGCDP